MLRVGLCVEQLRRKVPGGIGTYARGLIQGIRESDQRGEIALTLCASKSRAVPDPLSELGFALSTSSYPKMFEALLWERGRTRVHAEVSVAHAVSIATPQCAMPLSATVHDLAWRFAPETFPFHGRRWHEAALRRVAKRCTRVVVPSQAVADALIGAGVGIDADRIVVIDEGSDHLPAPDEAQTTAFLEHLGVNDGFLLAVGTLEPRKNLERLIAGYERARASFPEPWALVIAGPTGWGAILGERKDGVVLAGEVGATILSGLYARARCVAYVPLIEGFGLPVVEAMRAGAPVVSSDVPSAGGASELVDPYVIEDIARGLLRAAKDGARRDELRDAGHARVAPLTWRKTALAHLEIWRAIADERR